MDFLTAFFQYAASGTSEFFIAMALPGAFVMLFGKPIENPRAAPKRRQKPAKKTKQKAGKKQAKQKKQPVAKAQPAKREETQLSPEQMARHERYRRERDGFVSTSNVPL